MTGLRTDMFKIRCEFQWKESRIRMNDHTHRLSPEESFPDDLTLLSETDLEVLNSRLHRELENEYGHADPQLETEARLEEVNLELNSRENHRTV